MARLYLVSGASDIAKRRKSAPPGQLVEAWPDLYTTGDFWLGETSKQLLDGGEPLGVKLSLDASAVPIYYGSRLDDVDSLPLESSLQARVLSAHGIAVAWITRDQFGERTVYEPRGPADPVFYLRRPAGHAAHVWRLFRTRQEARVYMREHCGKDPEAREWAEALVVDDFEGLLRLHASTD